VSNTWLAPRSGIRLEVFVPSGGETERLVKLVSMTPQLASTP
jgi:hypothetical protein